MTMDMNIEFGHRNERQPQKSKVEYSEETLPDSIFVERPDVPSRCSDHYKNFKRDVEDDIYEDQGEEEFEDSDDDIEDDSEDFDENFEEVDQINKSNKQVKKK